MITITQKGDYSKATKYLQQLKKAARMKILNQYGQRGVAALSAATPIDSGLTASSWGYKVRDTGNGSEIVFTNSHINKGVPIAIILQYGHGTGTGGWVQGRDYINPAIRPVFDEIAEAIWQEVTRL